MRKMLSVLLVLAAVFAVHATAPSYSAVDAVYEWFIVDGYNPVTIADDTISNAAADTVTIMSNVPLESGYEYIVQKKSTTGGDGDASEISLQMYAVLEDRAGNTLQTVIIDTVSGTTTAAGESILLPFGGSAFGYQFDLYYATTVTDGDDAAIIVGDHYLIKRRPIQYQRRY